MIQFFDLYGSFRYDLQVDVTLLGVDIDRMFVQQDQFIAVEQEDVVGEVYAAFEIDVVLAGGAQHRAQRKQNGNQFFHNQ